MFASFALFQSFRLPVARMVETGAMAHDECLLCGTCADGCATRAIRLTFGSRENRYGYRPR